MSRKELRMSSKEPRISKREPSMSRKEPRMSGRDLEVMLGAKLSEDFDDGGHQSSRMGKSQQCLEIII